MESSTTFAFRSWRDALGHPFLDRVREERVATVLRETAPRQVLAGTVLNTPATTGSLHLVLRGRLQSYRLTPSGHQLLLEIVEVGSVAAELDRYHLLHATRAEFLHDAGATRQASVALERALELTLNPAEWRLLHRRKAEMSCA